MTVTIFGQILDLCLESYILSFDQSSVLPLNESLVIREAPLSYTNTAFHEHNREITVVFQLEAKFMIEERIDRVLQSHRRDVSGLNFIT